MLERFISRIKEKTTQPTVAPVLITALGDSVTQGCMGINVINHDAVYHNVLKGMLEKKYPTAAFSVINAGVGGESAAGGLKRLERDVLKHNPDLVLIGFCLNDACGGIEKLPQYRGNIESLLDATRKGCKADIIILTPNFMASRKNSMIAEQHMKFADSIIGTQNSGTLKAYVKVLKDVAESRKIPVADIHAVWEKMASQGLDTTAMLCNGLNHPDISGQRIIAETIMIMIEQNE